MRAWHHGRAAAAASSSSSRSCRWREKSEIQEYLWPDSGMTPPGYIPGMALSFAYARQQFAEGDDAATVMAKAWAIRTRTALAWYAAGVRAARHEEHDDRSNACATCS